MQPRERGAKVVKRRGLAAWWGGGCGLPAVALMAAMGPPPGDACPPRRPGDMACRDCHPTSPTFSHPVDVYPTMAVPAGLPLAGGRVTCITCHLPDRPAACGDCHDPRRGGRADIHGAALGRAHLLWPDGRGAPAGRTPAGLDAETETCLSCHDGALAPAPGIRVGSGGPPSAARILGGRHPIGVRQGPRGAGDNLVAPALLDPRIRLFDGRVGCGSCHNPYASDRAQLVMSNQRSALCLGCHDF